MTSENAFTAFAETISPPRKSRRKDISAHESERREKALLERNPAPTDDEIRASALQFVRKLSGFNKPSQANEAAFDRAVAEVTDAARRLLTSLHTHAPTRDRAVEAEKAKERSRLRFG